MLLKASKDPHELLVELRELLFEGVKVLGVADTSNHIFTLSVDQIVTVGLVLATGGITGEAHSGARVVVTVTKDHGLHIDRSTKVVRDALAVAIGEGTRAVPGFEDCFNSAQKLSGWVLREGLAGVLLDDGLVVLDQLLEKLNGNLRIRSHPGGGLRSIKALVKLFAWHFENDPAIHRHKTSIGVVGETIVRRLSSETLDGLVIEAKIQNRVHHSGH